MKNDSWSKSESSRKDSSFGFRWGEWLADKVRCALVVESAHGSKCDQYRSALLETIYAVFNEPYPQQYPKVVWFSRPRRFRSLAST